ncbi:S46 family peptidase [Bacteroidales bacterium OttesenSCG-928-L14]|nr:S46 family peptidase [Bacteroidales bacterium OttesenSCG-928-L14]
MKKILSILFVIILFNTLQAKEGMWLPILLQQLNEKEMQSMGMKISAEDIYSINQASLKDAIVIFGGGCTGEVVSNEGLLFTNYHCGYGNIQRHSSLDHDYLTDGFWAMDRNEELYCPGLTVRFLVRMEEVTNEALVGITDEMSQLEREKLLEKNIETITELAVDGTHYKAIVEEFYYGNQYFLFVYETFKDIRLVGAPPSNIGKFGGDTDNWMWPRHTGDFAVFRIYADNENMPADYSAENKPYTPKNFLKISLKGVDEGDFTFVFGYPGTTNEYLPAKAVECITEIENPISIGIRDQKLNVMNAYSEKDPLIRIQYANKIAGIANGWKKWIGESLGVQRVDGVQKKLDYETEFNKWAKTQNNDYSSIIETLNTSYDNIIPYKIAYRYFAEAGLGIELVGFARRFAGLVEHSKTNPKDVETLNKLLGNLKGTTKSFFKDYCESIDKELTPTLLQIYYENIERDLMPDFFFNFEKKFKGDFDSYTDHIFQNSMFTDKDKLLKFIEDYKPSHYKKIEKDPAYQIYSSLFSMYRDNVYPNIAKYQAEIDSTMRFYMKAQMEFEKDKVFYPDANFTLRVTYGNVSGFNPQDAVTYNYFTTLEGIMEKEDPNVYDYVVEDKLKELYNNKDYGRYVDKDGSMHVCFIASNHTTGGNSGSPVLNANGELIGLNFDRNWQGTMSDIMYDPDRCRNITLDIRYCLFIIDKYANAKHLLNEMVIVE